MSLQKSKIQWELMLPTEFRAAMKALPGGHGSGITTGQKQAPVGRPPIFAQR
jgi:hypothetical protein